MFYFLIKYIILYMMRENNIVISSIGAEYIWATQNKTVDIYEWVWIVFPDIYWRKQQDFVKFFCCCFFGKWLWRYRESRECGNAGSIPSCFKCQNIFEQISVRPWSEKSTSGKLSEKSISTNRNS